MNPVRSLHPPNHFVVLRPVARPAYRDVLPWSPCFRPKAPVRLEALRFPPGDNAVQSLRKVLEAPHLFPHQAAAVHSEVPAASALLAFPAALAPGISPTASDGKHLQAVYHQDSARFLVEYRGGKMLSVSCAGDSGAIVARFSSGSFSSVRPPPRCAKAKRPPLIS